jgi:hypothetical protein
VYELHLQECARGPLRRGTPVHFPGRYVCTLDRVCSWLTPGVVVEVRGSCRASTTEHHGIIGLEEVERTLECFHHVDICGCQFGPLSKSVTILTVQPLPLQLILLGLNIRSPRV